MFLVASVVAALVMLATELAVEERAPRGGVVFKSLWVVHHLYEVAVACTIWGIVYELIGTLLPWCRTKVYTHTMGSLQGSNANVPGQVVHSYRSRCSRCQQHNIAVRSMCLDCCTDTNRLAP